MRDTTLLFLVKKDNKSITDICLAMKKRGFGMGRYNGVGGKVEPGEPIEDAVKREAKEEIGVVVQEATKVGELTFIFPHEPTFDQVVHVYVTETWLGEIVESEEMRGEWFKVADIPYQTMWSDDILWLPQVLLGKYVSGTVVFAPGDVTTHHELNVKEL
ncbi:MAG: 8-oxo-dGTP diphosphatase [Candidatus Pacebacteria bacterium]|nr:8-oxo-dGTP diphosphatase [Candidatus Paceibacterota bacterium]